MWFPWTRLDIYSITEEEEDEEEEEVEEKNIHIYIYIYATNDLGRLSKHFPKRPPVRTCGFLGQGSSYAMDIYSIWEEEEEEEEAEEYEVDEEQEEQEDCYTYINTYIHICIFKH